MAWLLTCAGFASAATARSVEARARHERRELRDASGRVISDDSSGRVNYLRNADGVVVPVFAGPARHVEVAGTPRGATAGGAAPASSALPGASAGGAPSDPFDLSEEWRVGVYGSGIGESGLVLRDLDGDGVAEIVAGGATGTFGGDDFFNVIEHTAGPSRFKQRWTSDLVSDAIGRIAIFDTAPSGAPQIYLGLESGDVRIVDPETFATVATIDAPGTAIRQMQLADADNDGETDLVLVTDTTIYLYDPASRTLRRQLPYGASDAKVGNVDGDAANEIVLANARILQVNGPTVTVQWTYPAGEFGQRVELANLDADPALEIVGASDWYYVTVFDGDLESPLWQVPTDQDIGALELADVDGDQVPELLYGDGQWGEVHCVDVVTHLERWQIPNPEHGVTDIAVGDVDGDGNLEVMWGAGATSSGEDHLYVHELPSLAFEWANQHVDGPFSAVAVGDLDGDGAADIVTASFSSNSGYDDGIVTAFDGKTHAVKWSTGPKTFEGFAFTGLHALAIGDANRDGKLDVVVGTDRLYDGAIYLLDAATGALGTSYFLDEGAPIYSLAVADANGDGVIDLIAGGGREHTGAPGVYVYVIDGATGAVTWKSISLGEYWSAIMRLEVANVDADAAPEVVALDDWLFVIDGVSHVQWQSPSRGYRALDLADVAGDARAELVLGTNGGRIAALDGISHAEIAGADVASGDVAGVVVRDLDWDTGRETVYGNAGHLAVYDFEDGPLWQGATLGSVAGAGNALAVADVDGNGHNEVIAGTSHLVVQLETPLVLACHSRVGGRAGTTNESAGTATGLAGVTLTLLAARALARPGGSRRRLAAAPDGERGDAVELRIG